MGLLDVLNGMQNGPRGQRQPAPAGQSGGMSPLMMALLGLLAYKAMKGGGLGNILGGASEQAPVPDAGSSGSGQSGGLGDILGGMLGGGSSVGRSGGAQSGGLGDILGGALLAVRAGLVGTAVGGGTFPVFHGRLLGHVTSP